MFTIDASVWVNAVNSWETDHAASKFFLETVLAEKLPIIVPMTFRVEVAATFGRAGDKAAALAFVQGITEFRSIRWIAVDQTVAQEAAEIAVSNQLRGADAIYAAVAKSNNCILISRDGEHLERLAGTVRVMAPVAGLEFLKQRPNN